VDDGDRRILAVRCSTDKLNLAKCEFRLSEAKTDMREINLDRLRTLLTVARLGSFAAAAQALHLAPPTVTLHVAELEARLGTPLLLRGRRRVTPTAAGRVLVERGAALLADLDELLAEVQLHARGRRGRVRIGASTGAIAHRLPQALRALGEDHAGIDVQVSITTSAEAMARIAAGTLDIGIVALPQPRLAGVTLRPWRRDPVVAVLPADWAAPKRVTPAWLAARPLILNDAGTHLSRLCSAWFAAAGLQPQARVALNYNDAIRSLVAAGWGASLLPQEDDAAAHDPRLAQRPLSPPLWRPLGLAWHARGGEGAVRQVLGALQSSRGRHGETG
jgi:DNA-binding transcriptional LysR family regulator